MSDPTQVQWSECTALFGGTFDPPHLGHREAAQGLLQNPGVRKVIIVPSGQPPLKKSTAGYEHRVRMAEICFAGLRIDTREANRAGTSYSFDTIQDFKREIRELAFVIGADQLEGFPKWHRFPEITDLCHWIVLTRKPDGRERALQTMRVFEASGVFTRAKDFEWQTRGGRRLTLAETSARAASSTEIREELQRGGSPGALDSAVLAYLKAQRLYGT